MTRVHDAAGRHTPSVMSSVSVYYNGRLEIENAKIVRIIKKTAAQIRVGCKGFNQNLRLILWKSHVHPLFGGTVAVISSFRRVGRQVGCRRMLLVRLDCLCMCLIGHNSDRKTKLKDQKDLKSDIKRQNRDAQNNHKKMSNIGKRGKMTTERRYVAKKDTKQPSRYKTY